MLGLRAGAGGGESAKFWMNVLAEIKNRGVRDLSSWSATGSKVYPTAWPCYSRPPRCRLPRPPEPRHLPLCLHAVLRGHRQGPAPDLRCIDGGRGRRGAGVPGREWGKTYPAIPKLWRSAWEQFTPFQDYDVEIRKVLCARVGRLVSGTRANPLRHVPRRHCRTCCLLICKSTFGASPPISMPKRADWIVFATSRVSLVSASLRDRMFPGIEVRACV